MVAHISDDGYNREESVAEHTAKTEFLCRRKGERCGLPYIMSLCGLLHDVGKNKLKFDKYIHADKDTQRKLRGSIAHASTGAKYIYERYHDVTGKEKIMTEIISYAIAAHHGLFDCVNIEQTDIFSERLREIEDYDEACKNARSDYLDEGKVADVYKNALEEYGIVWDKIKNLLKELQEFLMSRSRGKGNQMLSDCRFFLFACLQRLILSILIDADWEATTDFMENVDTFSKQFEISASEVFEGARKNLDLFMQAKKLSANKGATTAKEKGIFEARNALQDECRSFSKHSAGIYCLPIPTGGGKTLSSLAYALEYCAQHPETERIIYVSPFISITEQNAEVIRNATGCDEWILEHHSSVIRDNGVDGEDYQTDKSIAFDMNWEEPFICTTFVQFMNTLFSEKRQSIRRMHRLVNAVVIIDEVQAMPLKCVHTFNYMISFLNRICNTNIILCTATQPALEEAQCPIFYSEPKYMVENVDVWFKKFERVKIHIPENGKKYTFQSLGNEIIEQISKYQSILIVLNTKSAVRKLYDLLKIPDVKVEYLTTNLCAEHRSDKIKSIKKALWEKQQKVIVVSTNLIEAGVDISFECVYRSMAGLDSVAQSAGRCNRNGEMEYGTMYLIEIEDENTGNMDELLACSRVTKQVLNEYREAHNAENLFMPKWMESYYTKVYSWAADRMNFPIEHAATSMIKLLSVGFRTENRINYMNQAYKTAGQEYRVIDDYSFGVIVPYGEGREIIRAIQETSDLADIKRYIRRMQRHVVNIRGNQLKKLDGLIQPVCDKFPNLYMIAVPGTYREDCGITPEWGTLIM